MAGFPRQSDTLVQIEFKNRFQVLQDTLDHEPIGEQWGHTFRVTDTQAKVHKKHKVTPITLDTQQVVLNAHIGKMVQSNTPQKTEGTELNNQEINNIQQKGDVIDLDSHMTDYQPVFDGNCDLKNKKLIESNPKDTNIVLGGCNNPGMCVEKQKCIAQTGGYFGFVPETSLKLYQGPPIYRKDIPTTLQAHKLVQSSGTHNYLGCRIPVNSHLKIDKWAYYLGDYWDQQIVDLLHYGFPLDFTRGSPLTSTYDNHTSALADIEHVNQYVEEELQHGAIIGPFDSVPCTLHLSPLMTRAKQDSHKKCTIMDLSWPPGQSVNAGVKNDVYLTLSILCIIPP